MKKIRALFIILAVIVILAATPREVQAKNLKLENYCKEQGMTLVLVEVNGYGWRCQSNSGTLYNLDLNAYCQAEFGERFIAKYMVFSDPYSWNCFPVTSGFPQK